MPILALGATGLVAADKRRPWIDWIHTAKEQGALVCASPDNSVRPDGAYHQWRKVPPR